ncbi:MAG: helix-turn-helix transcriptional regulator [Clostridiales bacterium]|nr:helix-turn-helix transcriptional regulator [Clostridiales bacterium]
MQLSTEISQKRKKLKISQRELAQRCGLPQSTVGRIEAGIVTPSLPTLQKLANELGMKLSLTPKNGADRWDGLEMLCFWNDELVSYVTVKNNKVKVQRFTEHPVKQIFRDDEIDVFKLSTILETRCWQRDCRNIDNYLKKLGIPYYDPLAIVKKTHGVSYNDFLWFRFNGESLTWKDVAPKRLRNV